MTSASLDPFDLRVELPVPPDVEELAGSELDGDDAGEVQRRPGGELVVAFDRVRLEPGEQAGFELRLR